MTAALRILFVAMPNSVHAARWISQIADQGWDLSLFPAFLAKPHPSLKNINVLGFSPLRPFPPDKSARYISWPNRYFYRDIFEGVLRRKPSDRYKEAALIRAIETYRPDIVHSLEFQHAGYLAAGAKEKLGRSFPAWIATNWGSDIYLFRNMPEQKPKIERILQQCDYYSCECERDIRLAREMGFAGKTLPVLPNAGGLPLEQIERLRAPGSVADRKTIIVKGYQGWSGRALVALEAVGLCKDTLHGYSIAVYSAPREVVDAAGRISRQTGIPIKIIPRASHEAILRVFGRSRIYIGLGISDGISTSFLEAMAMGAFPIQSCTACADEWIQDGRSGFIVPPEDPQAVAGMLRRALADDALVNRADEINAQTVRERLDYSKIKSQVVQMYGDIMKSRKD